MVKFKSNELKNFAYEIYKRINSDELPVFLCVGSDKVICDSLAPIVGELLTKRYNIPAYVYGGLDYTINGLNLAVANNYIESVHPRSQIIMIDATLGDDIGDVIVTDGSYAGLGKILPIRKIGNFSILGVVGKKTKSFNLNTTRLQLVSNLAHFIARGIAMALFVYSKKATKPTLFRHNSRLNSVKFRWKDKKY